MQINSFGPRILVILLVVILQSWAKPTLAADQTTTLPLDGTGQQTKKGSNGVSYPVNEVEVGTENSDKRKSAKAEQDWSSYLGAVEVGGQYPMLLGLMSQELFPSYGFHVAVQLNLLRQFKTGLFVGFQNFTVPGDNTASFQLMPVLLKCGVEGQTGVEWIHSVTNVGVGMAFGWLNTQASASWHVNAYFSAQVEPGLEFLISDQFRFVAHIPVTYIVGSTSMGYLGYDGGLKFVF